MGSILVPGIVGFNVANVPDMLVRAHMFVATFEAADSSSDAGWGDLWGELKRTTPIVAALIFAVAVPATAFVHGTHLRMLLRSHWGRAAAAADADTDDDDDDDADDDDDDADGLTDGPNDFDFRPRCPACLMVCLALVPLLAVVIIAVAVVVTVSAAVADVAFPAEGRSTSRSSFALTTSCGNAFEYRPFRFSV